MYIVIHVFSESLFDHITSANETFEYSYPLIIFAAVCDLMQAEKNFIDLHCLTADRQRKKQLSPYISGNNFEML